MDELFNKYSGQVRCSSAEIDEEFLKIYEQDEHIKDWLDALATKLDFKDDDEANRLRRYGNKLYASKRFQESFEIYTKAMCTASANGNEIGLIAANRSALLYMIDYFEDCLRDIEFSLLCSCPDDVKIKLYVRRIKCYAKMNVKNQLEEAKKDALDFLESFSVVNKDAKIAEIVSSGHVKPSQGKRVFEEEVPLLTSGCNPIFLYAASAIRLSYDKLRGRHVLANEDIEPDDVLFVETPFIFAPVFVNDHMEMSSTKCYGCLKTIYSSIPCSYCIKTIYCDKKCRSKCWDEFHRWECFGMQCNLWYHVGIGFPALRAVIKGIPTGLCTLKSGHEDDIDRFGEIGNNYSYFNKLVSNMSKMDNVLPLIVSAGVIVNYLEKHTVFFKWLSEQVVFNRYSKTDLVGLIGGRITKHIAQLQCNSSLIDHFKDVRESVACAIYPSISMMNHSCYSNVKICYIGAVAVVRAAEKIAKDEEVFNCYGIDYRYADRRTRQDRCSQYYYFNCDCRICKCSELELFFPKS